MRYSISSFSSKDLVVVRWTDRIDEAYALMRQKGFRHLPVADDNGFIVGIISDRDFARAMQIDQADFASGYPSRASFDPQHSVRDFMSWPVESIEESASIIDAARLMLDKKISALLVTARGEVTGIVTTEDMLRALIQTGEGASLRLIDRVEGALLQSPVGQIAHALGNAGI